MTLFIDPPAWPAHGRLWSHLVSDRSLQELHEFAAAHGVPRRGFERDHYDVPAELYDSLVAAGALPVSARDVVSRLQAAGLRRRKGGAMARRAPGNALLRPPRLVPGSLVAVVAPAGPVPEESLEAGLDRLHRWGLHTRLGRHVLARHPTLGYLAGSDGQRVDDFTAAWMDDQVAAVVTARGGYGSQRVVDGLDWKRLAEAAPKILMGFSDVTALHQACAARLGVVTIHGPSVTSLGRADPEAAEAARRLLLEPDLAAERDLLAGRPVRVLAGGHGRGVLVGGNLSMLAAEVGTPFSRPAHGGIAVLEDVNEPAYRIDRLLTQLLRSGWFDGVRGVVAGAFTGSVTAQEVEQVLADRLGGLGVPVLSGIDVGHVTSARPVPLGVRAVLDADPLSLRLEGPPLA